MLFPAQSHPRDKASNQLFLLRWNPTENRVEYWSEMFQCWTHHNFVPTKNEKDFKIWTKRTNRVTTRWIDTWCDPQFDLTGVVL